MAPDLDHLNELGYRLPLNDKEIKRMQSLNRHWSLVSSQTTERFRYSCRGVWVAENIAVETSSHWCAFISAESFQWYEI